MEYQIKGLGALGVIADIAPNDLPPNGFTDAMNARFIDSRVYKMEGNNPISYHDEDKDKTFLSLLPVPFDKFSSDNSFLIAGDWDSSDGSSNLYKVNDQGVVPANRRERGAGLNTTIKVTVNPKANDLVFVPSSLSVSKNQNTTIVGHVIPKGATLSALKWQSNNTAVATVTPGTPYLDPETDPNKNLGMLYPASVHAANVGTAVISAITDDGSVAAFLTTTVKAAQPGVDLNTGTLSIRRGFTASLAATLTDITGSVTWESSNPAAVSVTQTGLTTTLSGLLQTSAPVIITARSTTDATKTATCQVSVTQGVDSVTVTPPSVSELFIGSEQTVNAAVVPAIAINKKVTWTLSKPGVVSIESSTDTSVVVKGVAEGVVDVIATSEDAGKVGKCTITVKTPPTPFVQGVTIALNPIGGSLSRKTVNQTYTTEIDFKSIASSGAEETNSLTLLNDSRLNVTASTNASNGEIIVHDPVQDPTTKKYSVTIETKKVSSSSGIDIVVGFTYGSSQTGTSTRTIYIDPEIKPVTELIINPATIDSSVAKVGSKIKVLSTVHPADASSTDTIWISTNHPEIKVEKAADGSFAEITFLQESSSPIVLDVSTVGLDAGGSTITQHFTINSIINPVDLVQSITVAPSADYDPNDFEVSNFFILEAKVLPATANQTVKWRLDGGTPVASDPTLVENEFAVLDTNTGAILAKKVGTISITAAAQDASNIVSSAYSLAIKDAVPNTIVFDAIPTTLQVGNNFKVQVGVYPTGAAQTVTLASSDPAVLKVDATDPMTIVGVAPGTATITATHTNGLLQAVSPTVTVTTPPLGAVNIRSNMDIEKLIIGYPQQLSVEWTPSTVADKTFTWVYDNTMVDIDSNNIITPKAGSSGKSFTLDITPHSDANIKDPHTVTISSPPVLTPATGNVGGKRVGDTLVFDTLFNFSNSVPFDYNITANPGANADINPINGDVLLKATGNVTITATHKYITAITAQRTIPSVAAAAPNRAMQDDYVEDTTENVTISPFSTLALQFPDVFGSSEKVQDAPVGPVATATVRSIPAVPKATANSTDYTVEEVKVTLNNATIEVDKPVTINIQSIKIKYADGTEEDVDPDNNDKVMYEWQFNRGGIVSANATDLPSITLQGLAAGTVEVRLTVYAAKSGVYKASPKHPWYHALIANCAVATTYAETPQIKQFSSKFFEDLPGWGEQTSVDNDGNVNLIKYDWKCERVRSFNNRLFALNMRETTVSGFEQHFPLRLRWSNFAEEDKAPTLWDDYAYLRDPDNFTTSAGQAGTGEYEALKNGYAGYIDLADSNGGLIDILPLKDYIFVYTEFETYIGTPTMNTYSPFLFKKIFNDSGILAPDCAVEVDGGHFVVTQNDIILHNGSTKKSLVTSRVRKKIINEVSSVNPLATKVHLRQDKNEVWVLYVAPGSEKDSGDERHGWYCNKAAVWNYEFDTWTFRSVPYAYAIALVDPPVLDKSGSWQQFSNITWDKTAGKTNIDPVKPWQRNDENFHKRIVIVPSAIRGFVQMDIGSYDVKWSGTYADNTNKNPNGITYPPLEMFIQRSGIDFDNATQEWNQKHVNTLRPQVSGRGTYQFEVGGSQYSNEIGHSHSVKTFTAGRDRLVAVRLNHPYLYYNVYDRDPNSTLGLHSLIIEYTVGGRR